MGRWVRGVGGEKRVWGGGECLLVVWSCIWGYFGIHLVDVVKGVLNSWRYC